MKLIDKEKVVAEIERIKKEECSTDSYEGRCKLLWFEQFLSFIDALEVKEVDFEKCYHDFLQKEWFDKNCNRTISEMMSFTAKYFYELGLAQKGETELLKVKGFLVRDKDDYTAIYAEKPHRGKTEWVNGNGSCLMTINDARLVPDIEFEDEPVEVEVTLKRV